MELIHKFPFKLKFKTSIILRVFAIMTFFQLLLDILTSFTRSLFLHTPLFFFFSLTNKFSTKKSVLTIFKQKRSTNINKFSFKSKILIPALVLFSTNMFTPTNSLIFNGGYARFKLWDTAGLKSHLSFKFKTGKASGLLFYFDDGGINDGFMCLQLQKGKIYLRYKASRRETQHELVAENEDPNAPQKGFSSSFADNKWHLVVVQRDRGRVRLAVDKGMSPDRKEWMEYFSVGSNGIELKSATSLYFGGIPKTFRVTDLSLPAAKWMKPFYGEIEKTQIDFVDLNVIQSENVVLAEELLCTKDDPCHNGGKCRVVNGEQRCECPMYYQGDLCEKRKLTKNLKSPMPMNLKSPAPNPFEKGLDLVIGEQKLGKKWNESYKIKEIHRTLSEILN